MEISLRIHGDFQENNWKIANGTCLDPHFETIHSTIHSWSFQVAPSISQLKGTKTSIQMHLPVPNFLYLFRLINALSSSTTNLWIQQKYHELSKKHLDDRGLQCKHLSHSEFKNQHGDFTKNPWRFPREQLEDCQWHLSRSTR